MQRMSDWYALFSMMKTSVNLTNQEQNFIKPVFCYNTGTKKQTKMCNYLLKNIDLSLVAKYLSHKRGLMDETRKLKQILIIHEKNFHRWIYFHWFTHLYTTLNF